MSDARPGPAPAYAIGIGAQKCASSWLHTVLAAHPGVAAAAVKEVDFFSYHHDRGHAWYRRQFAGPGLRFENSPSYLHDPRSPGRLARFAPGARILFTLRDPVERALSHHRHEIAKGHIPVRPFQDALAENPDYLEQSFYARHLKRWRAEFRPEAMLGLIAEEIATAPEATRQTVMEFLGLDPETTSHLTAARQNVSDSARLTALRAALRAGGAALRKAGLEEPLYRLKQTPPVAALMNWNSVSLSETVPPLSAGDRIDLARLFADDMRELAELLKRPSLPWESWRAAEPARRAQRYPSAMNRAAPSRPAMRLPSGTGCVPSPERKPAGLAT